MRKKYIFQLELFVKKVKRYLEIFNLIRNLFHKLILNITFKSLGHNFISYQAHIYEYEYKYESKILDFLLNRVNDIVFKFF